jgi:hypothetical protein
VTPTRRTLRPALAAAVGLGLLASPVAAAPGSPVAPATAQAANPTPWWPAAMGFDALAKAGATGQGVTVAVLDGTIDPGAADVKGRIASVDTPCKQKATGTGEDADHATQIAQVIVGTGASSGGTAGVRGIAPKVTLRHYSLGVGDPNQCQLSVDEDATEAILPAMKKALADGAKVVNLSFGGSGTDEQTEQAVTMAQHAGAIVVAATGEGSLSYPAGYNGVVAVNGCDSKGQLDPRGANAHSYGVAFCAPGMGLVVGKHRGSTWVGQGALVDGTSYSAPLVAGGLAAYWSKYPRATANQVLQAALRHPGMRQGTSTNGTKGWIYAYRRVGSGFPTIQDASRTGFGWGIFAPADLVGVDPTTYPDRNPLLREDHPVGPTAQEVAAGTLAGQEASTPAGSSSSSPSTSGSGTATPTASPSSVVAAPGQSAPESSSGSGMPAWVWALLAVVVVAAAGGALAVSRRGAGTTPAHTTGEES